MSLSRQQRSGFSRTTHRSCRTSWGSPQSHSRAIKQNRVFSLAVLGPAVRLTITGILTPVTGALLYELSSIPVIANSVRLIGLRERSA